MRNSLRITESGFEDVALVVWDCLRPDENIGVGFKDAGIGVRDSLRITESGFKNAVLT